MGNEYLIHEAGKDGSGRVDAQGTNGRRRGEDTHLNELLLLLFVVLHNINQREINAVTKDHYKKQS